MFSLCRKKKQEDLFSDDEYRPDDGDDGADNADIESLTGRLDDDLASAGLGTSTPSASQPFRTPSAQAATR